MFSFFKKTNPYSEFPKIISYLNTLKDKGKSWKEVIYPDAIQRYKNTIAKKKELGIFSNEEDVIVEHLTGASGLDKIGQRWIRYDSAPIYTLIKRNIGCAMARGTFIKLVSDNQKMYMDLYFELGGKNGEPVGGSAIDNSASKAFQNAFGLNTNFPPGQMLIAIEKREKIESKSTSGNFGSIITTEERYLEWSVRPYITAEMIMFYEKSIS